MKKKIALALTISLFCFHQIYSQNLSKISVTPYLEDKIPVNVCNDGNLGIIVFYSAIKTLRFEAVYPKNAIINKPEFQDNCYILCVQPQESTNFSIKIIGDGFEPYTHIVGEVIAKRKNIFMINTEDNIVEVTVFDKDGNPLPNGRVRIKETDYEVRGDNKGVYKVELSNSKPAMLIISHRNYEDTVEIIINSGDKPEVQLYKIKKLENDWKKEGDIWIEKCNYKKALESYEEALRIAPQNPTFKRIVDETKILIVQQNHMDKAKEYYKSAESINKPKWSENKTIMRNYINSYKRSVDEVEKAESLGSLHPCMQNDADIYRKAYKKSKKIVNGKRTLYVTVAILVVGGIVIYTVVAS